MVQLDRSVDHHSQTWLSPSTVSTRTPSPQAVAPFRRVLPVGSSKPSVEAGSSDHDRPSVELNRRWGPLSGPIARSPPFHSTMVLFVGRGCESAPTDRSDQAPGTGAATAGRAEATVVGVAAADGADESEDGGADVVTDTAVDGGTMAAGDALGDAPVQPARAATPASRTARRPPTDSREVRRDALSSIPVTILVLPHRRYQVGRARLIDGSKGTTDTAEDVALATSPTQSSTHSPFRRSPVTSAPGSSWHRKSANPVAGPEVEGYFRRPAR